MTFLLEFRKGGLAPAIYVDFIKAVHQLPLLHERTVQDFKIFEKFNLTNISDDELSIALREVFRRAIEASKKCWHPEASATNCSVKNGKILISAAHSIQNNGVLGKIVEDGHVMGYELETGEVGGKLYGRNKASIFWGFCNKHDGIFKPIETAPYVGTDEQHFLYAYRAFVVSAHKKREATEFMDFGIQAQNDIDRTKAIFDSAILSKEYSIVVASAFLSI